jgi:hypothetical protein
LNDVQLSWLVYILPYIEQEGLYDQFDLTSTGGYTINNRLQPHGLKRIETFLCPSSPVKQMMTVAPHNVNTPDIVNGTPAFTTHYYGVVGPKNQIPGAPAGTNYRHWATGSHGGFAQQGMFAIQQAVQTLDQQKIGLRDVLDGTSNTFMIGELSWTNDKTGTRYRPWLRGTDFAWTAAAKNVDFAIGTPQIATFNDIAFGSMHPGGTHMCFGDNSVRFVSRNVSFGIYKATASRDGSESKVISNN